MENGPRQPGASLEDIYLKTRLAGESSTENFRETPSISTEADRKTREAMGEDYNLQDITSAGVSEFKRKGFPACADSDETEKIATEFEQLATAIEEGTTVDQSTNLKEFRALQGKIAGQRLYNSREMERRWKAAGSKEILGNCLNPSASACWDPAGRSAQIYSESMGFPKSCQAQRELFLKVCKDPEILRLYEARRKLEKSADYDRLQKLEAKLMHDEAKTYDTIYRKQAKTLGSEACRDFKF